MRRVGMIATLVAAAIGVASGALAQGSPPGAPPPAKAGRATLNLVLVLDGLRPDAVTPEETPNLWRLRQEGVNFPNSHAVFPTVTRVNATAITTGTYPARNGILDNRIGLDRDPTLPPFDGRPIVEAFVDGPDQEQVPMRTLTHITATPDGAYRVAIQVSEVGTQRYIDKSWRMR